MGLSTLYEFPFGTGVNPWLSLARINAQAVCLLTQRGQAYLDLSKGLGDCKTADDLMTQQVVFWQIAQRQYLDTVQNTVLAALPAVMGDQSSEPPASRERARDYLVVAEAAPAAVAAAKELTVPKQANTERLRRSA